MTVIIFQSQSQNSVIVSDSKLFLFVWLPFSAVSSQMPPPQGTPSLGWLTAPSRPATASGLSQSRCLCTPRSSPPSMKVRVCYCLLSVFCTAFFLKLFSSLFSCFRTISQHVYGNSQTPNCFLSLDILRACFCLVLLSFPNWYLIFWVSLIPTDASSQLLKGWITYYGTLNHRVVEELSSCSAICQ